MSNPSPDTPDHQSPDPLSFKVPAGLLLILLGTLGFMAAFGQMLSYIFYINSWLNVVLSLLQLLVTVELVGAGAMMLMRRAAAERLSPWVGLVGTVALLVLDLAGSFVRNGTASGALLPSLMAIPIFLLLGVGLFRSRHLLPRRVTRAGIPAEPAAAVPSKIAVAPATVASLPKKATPATSATKAKQAAPAAKPGPVTSANPINKSKPAGNTAKNARSKPATQAQAAASKRPSQARQVSRQVPKSATGTQAKQAPVSSKAKQPARSKSGK